MVIQTWDSLYQKFSGIWTNQIFALNHVDEEDAWLKRVWLLVVVKERYLLKNLSSESNLEIGIKKEMSYGLIFCTFCRSQNYPMDKSV